MIPLQKKFNMTIADLAMFASNLVVKMNRDATPFAARGVDALAITAFETLGNAYEVFPPDIDFLGQVMEAVDIKDALRVTVTQNIQLISGFVEQKWGLDSPRYKRLGISNLQRMSDNDFLKTTRNVVDKATDWLADLTSIGLTQGDIDTLDANGQLWENAANDVDELKTLREEKARERMEKGNELYSFVTQYCTIGKLIWENVNEVYYDDYVIYHTTTQMPGKVLNMAWDYPTRTVSWDAAAHADSYQLERKYSSDPDWLVVYEGADTSVVNDPVTAGTWLYRCRGQNENGYGDWSDELIVLMPT